MAHEDALALAVADPTLTDPLHVPLAHEVQERFGAYFEEVKRV
jgi:ATP-dependent DNA helicase RecG